MQFLDEYEKVIDGVFNAAIDLIEKETKSNKKYEDVLKIVMCSRMLDIVDRRFENYLAFEPDGTVHIRKAVE
jgi:hypothetical protein